MNIDNNKIGALGEAKVLAYLIENDYTVFTQFDGKAPFDFVCYKDKQLYRVSVKTTRVRDKTSWQVQLRSIRSNTNKVVHPFDNTEIDLLAVYIPVEDRVVLLDAKTIKNKTGIAIRVLTTYDVKVSI